MRHQLRRSAALLPLLAGTLALSACGKEATGQVAAVVNGDEITLQEVNAEIGQAKLPEGAEKEKARSLVLQRLIDKKLLEQQAKSSGLDRDPDYLLKQRQLSQTLLIELYAKRAQDTLKVPDQAAVARYMAEHPTNFANRTIYTVDQIRFAPPRDQTVIAGLKDAHTIDAVAALLKDKGIQSQRGSAKIDSAAVPAQLMTQILSLPAGEPFVIPTPQGVVASVITGREVVPLPAAQAQPMAVQMIRAQALDDIVKQRLKEARDKAKITYQSGFSPAPIGTPSGAPNGAAAPAK